MTKKMTRLRQWLKEKQEIAIDNHDYTKEMTLREVIKKVDELS